MKICWANTDNFDEAEIVIVGIPDESKSHSLRKGTSEAPHKIREISSIRDTYKRGNNISLGLPFSGINKKVYDYGNIERSEVTQVIDKIVSKSKIPLSIGGDHSISAEIIKSVSKKHGQISLVYFYGHPHFISSLQSYHSSVLHDVIPLIHINLNL